MFLAVLNCLIFVLPLSADQAEFQTIDPLKLERTQRLVIPRLQGGSVKLDGPSDEPCWEAVRSFLFVQQSPQFGVPPSERTEALVAFDDEFLFVAGRLFDREPEKIQAPTKKRDAMVASTEWFGFVLDTFNDKENGLAFFTTPSGLRLDAAVFNDAQPRSPDPSDVPINLSWNTFWDVAVAVTGDGWFVEMRIPLSSLRFQDEDGRVVMGITFFRWIAHKNESAVFPAIPAHWGQLSAWKSSQAQEIEFQGLYAKRPLYITPYILGGGSRTFDLNEPETAYVRMDTPKFEFGVDAKYSLTSNLTLDITANTDFAQVEADDAQVNLTRFSLFFPEKRVFFLERTSNFDFNMGGTNTLFYSRRIGLYEDKPVRIYGGARVVGRVGDWDLGFLDMQTAPLEDQPSENFGVLRLRKRVVNSYSYIGGIITSRIGMDGSYNITYGLDGIFRLSGDDYLSIHCAQTYKTGAANDLWSLNPTKIGLNWERRTQKDLGYRVRFSRAGRDFDPGMGFMRRENYTALSARALYGWFPGETSSLFSHNVFVDGLAFWANSSGRLESLDFGPGWEFSMKSGWSGAVGPKLYFEDVSEALSFSDETEVPLGRYTFGGLQGMLTTPQGKLMSAIITLDAGTFYDGHRFSLGLIPQWSIVPDVELSGMLQFNDVRFPGRGQKFFAPIAQIKLLTTLSTALSASAMVQYSKADDALIANVRLRYNPREGTDVYLVYNEGMNTHRLREIPILPFTSDRTIVLKFNYTLH